MFFKLIAFITFTITLILDLVSPVHSQICSQSYTVISGDTCNAIAAKFGVTASAIISANPAINSGCTNLQIGQVLCIPGGSCSTSYTVISGDTCNAIAAKFGVTASAIISANPAINSGCTNLQIGQVLCIPGGSTSSGDSRLIAFLGNWQNCPSDAQIAKYTHIVVAFAVTYIYQEPKNACDQSCTIGTPVPVCNNAPNGNLVAAWRAAGKKVILSFGGAGMGGSWDGLNNCWDYCFGKEDSVITQLTNIVKNQGFDGVDIDYEYYYSTTQQQNFISKVTTGLRAALPAGSIVTHAPMDSDLVVGRAYYEVLRGVSASLSFLMPQYYNGITRPALDGIAGQGAGQTSALSHYTNLVNNMFNGDPTKVVFGFCISDCSDSNVNAQQAVKIMNDLKSYYPCNGGAFFWVAEHDSSASWSTPVSQVIQSTTGCSNLSKPLMKPISKPAPKIVPVKPVVKPVKPVPKPAKPVPKPAKPVPKPVKPVPKPVNRPVQKPAIKPIAMPRKTPVKFPVLTPSQKTCSSMEEQIDYTGNDICSACPSSPTAEGCCSICAATSTCGAFTWTNYNGGTCWLKTGKTSSTSCTGCRSAILGLLIPNWESCTKGVGACADNWQCCVAPADCVSGKTTCRPGGNECSSCSSSKTMSLLNRITGTQVVSGQHNDEKKGEDWAYYTNLVRQTTGKYPGLWSGDFVYSRFDHNSMVQEALRQWNSGAIINIMWHGCPPRPGSGYTCDWNGGVISRLSDSEWSSLISDGSSWNVEWKKRMDYVGEYLKTLKSQGVEVMFRPLHEMNQEAFWWGGRTGASGTRRLYQITRDYMEKSIGLTNLIWVWNVQDLSSNYWEYNPGSSYFDVASLDIYGNGYYDDTFYYALLTEAGNKPVGIGETFSVPYVSYLNNHKRLSFFMVWADGGEQMSDNVKNTYSSGIVLTRENLNRG